MSSGSIKKGFQNYLTESKSNEWFIGVSNSKVSFLSLSKNKKKADIYSDTKNIPFKELNPEFIKILQDEFTDALLKKRRR